MRWLNLLLILTTFIAYLAPQVSPTTFSLFSFFGLLYPWLVLSNLLFIIYWVYRKRWYALFSIGCLLVGMNYLPTLIGFNFSDEELPNTAKVVSYNLYGLRGWGDRFKYQHGYRLEDFKKEKAFRDVDIFAGQEMGAVIAKQIGKTFGLKNSVQHIGNGLLTKYPIKDKGVITFGKNTGNSCVWMDVVINKKRVRVYGLHLQSNKISGVTSKIAKEGNLREKETWLDIKTVMGGYRRAAKRRAAQAQKVAAHIAKCPYPVILCGDFNDTPLSYTYQVFANNRKDSFCEKGLGFGTTYAGSVPALRIDYILADEAFEIASYQRYKFDYSDHYGIGAEIGF